MSLVILCPGQGAQHAGMLDLLDGERATDVVARGAAALGVDLRALLADPDQLYRNAVAQPLLCLIALARWTSIKDALPDPIAIAGYSVGELASYACAGALDAAELARLAATRARLMDAAADRPGGLVALQGMRRAPILGLCETYGATIAIAISDDSFVVGAHIAALAALGFEGERRGLKVTPLKVGVAAHTPLLAAAVEPFRQALERARMGNPTRPVVAGIDGTLVARRDVAISALASQVATTIEWGRCLDTLFEHGARVFLELGPGNALSRIVQARFGAEVAARSLDDFRSPKAAIAWVGNRLG